MRTRDTLFVFEWVPGSFVVARLPAGDGLEFKCHSRTFPELDAARAEAKRLKDLASTAGIMTVILEADPRQPPPVGEQP